MAIIENTFVYINIVMLIISFPGNILIIAVNILDFCKNRRLPVSDQLIFGCSVFSLLHGLVEIVQFAIEEYHLITAHILMYFNIGTICFSALLNIHFCLKIVNINHWFYIGLQRRFSMLIYWPLMTFLLGYTLINFLSLLYIKQKVLLNTTSAVVESQACSWSLFICMSMSVFDTLLCLVSTLTIVIHLFQHMKRIQENTMGSRSPNMEVYIRTVITVTTLLAANILLFSSMFFRCILVALNEMFGLHLFSILISTCHIFSSYFIIKGTKKLDTVLVKVLNQCLLLLKPNQ
ncbi:hypothetical protein GDO78_010227 [Eleutherodactylus coqui]|uniref:Taste receptor type 2 n=1 Tax=Eleutherodactylus coqui TaxID=57060 RepID=A0A8J6K9U1_ELECQ|nr:hypothetical protein GDO78_010227 [Eleutherodactylus coqui]